MGDEYKSDFTRRAKWPEFAGPGSLQSMRAVWSGVSSHLALLAMPNAEYCQVSSPCKPSGLVVKDLGISDVFWVVLSVQQVMMLLAATSQRVARGARPSFSSPGPAAPITTAS